MKNGTERMQYIDCIRGIAVFFVVWGHFAGALGCQTGDLLSKIITTFNMPLFAFLSGMLYRCRKNVPYYRVTVHKFRRLIVPVLCWNALATLPKFLYKRGAMSIGVMTILGESLDLWFLNSIFCVYIIYDLVCRISTTEKMSIVLNTLVILGIWLIPSNLWHIGFLYPFFFIGCIIGAKIKGLVHRESAFLCFLIFCVYCLILFTFTTDEYIYYSGTSLTISKYSLLRQLYINLKRILLALLAMNSIFWLYFERIENRKSMIKPIQGLCKWGQYSLDIYIMHVILVSYFLKTVLKKAFPMLMQAPIWFEIIRDYVLSPVLTILVIALCIEISRFIGRKKLAGSLLLGKN